MSGIKNIKKGDAKSVTKGVIDLANGIASFMPPPAGQLLQSISTLSALFLGKLSHDIMKNQICNSFVVNAQVFSKA